MSDLKRAMWMTLLGLGSAAAFLWLLTMAGCADVHDDYGAHGIPIIHLTMPF